jgi:hypothetical protein
MLGLTVEFLLVVAAFLILWRRQIRERQRQRERASQLDFDFSREQNRGA